MKIGRLGILLLVLAAACRAQELALKVVLDPETGRPGGVEVSGKVQESLWLGISFYPYGTENVLLDGSHQVLQIDPGKFRHEFALSERFVNGSVECALWSTKVEPEACDGPCQWCEANGYHLDNRQIYLYGSLAESDR